MRAALLNPPSSPEQADARSAAACLDLIEEHNSPASLNETTVVRIEDYGAAGVRIVLKAVDLDPPVRISVGCPLVERRDPDEQRRVESSVQRTKKTIRQRCLAFRVDRLLTLTYRENMRDRTRAYEDCTRFVEAARRAGVLADYVAVPEQQKRGAWHIHLAVRGYLPVMTLRRIWRSIVGADNGNVDISYQRGNPTPWRIASYIAKYIGKAVEQCPPGQRTFWASEWTGRRPARGAFIVDGNQLTTQVLDRIRPVLEQLQAERGFRLVDYWWPKPREGRPPGIPPLVVIHLA
jgi:hypothetical protein